MTEIGVYILGATALVLLAVAGVALHSNAALICAVVAAGSAYVSQLGAYHTVVAGRVWSAWLNGLAMIVSLLAWMIGALSLL